MVTLGRRSLLLAGVAVPVASARSQCVTDTPAVDACRGGVRTTVPYGATLDLSFFGPTLAPSLTFTRASTATYFDASGVMQTAATNAPRFDYDPVTHAALGLLIEEQRTNVLLNSATLGTQSVAVTAQAYTLSFYGTGTVTLSGVSTAGPLVGTGAFPTRVALTFTPTAGTLTCTVTGSVLNAQLEAGAFSTSWIGTAAAAVTRSADACSILPAQMGFYTPPGGSWMAEFIMLENTSFTSGARVVGQYLAGGGTPSPLIIGTPLTITQWDGSGAATTANSTTVGAVAKGASTSNAVLGTICLNSGAVASVAQTTGYPLLKTAGVVFLSTTVGVGESLKAGYIRRVRYWPRVLSNAELQQVTR